jgi:hypothetical protein
MVGGLIACAAFAVIAVIGLTILKNDAPIEVSENANHDVPIDMTNKNLQDHSTPSAKAVVNIDGIITKVGEDGMSYTLDNGMEVVVTEKTVLGITGPTAAPKEEQFFEPTFRVGNGISGYTEDPTANPVFSSFIVLRMTTFFCWVMHVSLYLMRKLYH